MSKSKTKFPACAILAEDRSDVATLRVIIKRLAENASLQVKGKGFDGCGDLLKKGAAQLRVFAGLGFEKFIVCVDADGPDPKRSNDRVKERVIGPSGLEETCVVVVPVHELEAWILADIAAVSKTFSSWRPKEIPNPEAIKDPKEHLERLSRDGRARPRYSHAMHNAAVAKHLDLDTVLKKCDSFRPLHEFVREA